MNLATNNDYTELFRIYAEEHGYNRKHPPTALSLVWFIFWCLFHMPGVLVFGFLYGQEVERARADAKAAPRNTDPREFMRKWVALRNSHFTKTNRSSRAQVVRAMQQIHNSNDRSQHVQCN